MQNILQLLEGMTPDQVREFRRRIVPALEQIRAEVVTPQAAKASDEKTTRGKSDEMHSNNNQRQTV